MTQPETNDEAFPQMLRIRDAARQLDVSVNTVWRLIRSGKLNAYNIGGIGITRVKASELSGLLQERE